MAARCLPIRRIVLDRHRIACAVTLLAFFASAIGIPATPFGQPTAGCQCDKQLKAAGQCCCTKAKRGRELSSCCKKTSADDLANDMVAAVRPCCAKRPSVASQCVASVKSCCAKKSSAPRDSGKSDGPFFSACGCGGSPQTDLLVNAEPRILTNTVLVAAIDGAARWTPRPTPFPASLTISPETPPPKVRPLHRSLA